MKYSIKAELIWADLSWAEVVVVINDFLKTLNGYDYSILLVYLLSGLYQYQNVRQIAMPPNT